MYVHTFVLLKLEEAIQSEKFGTQVQKASLNVLYTAWWLKTIISKELKAFGLTHEQFNVLRILKGKHPDQMCVRDIGNRMIEKSSNVPRIIDRLELKKLALRSTSTHDKRETVITITPVGITLIQEATAALTPVIKKTLAVNEDEATTINQLLEKMRLNE